MTMRRTAVPARMPQVQSLAAVVVQKAPGTAVPHTGKAVKKAGRSFCAGATLSAVTGRGYHIVAAVGHAEGNVHSGQHTRC